MNNPEPDLLRSIARRLYTRYGSTAAEITGLLNIDENMLRQWATEGSWDLIRTSLSLSRDKQLEILYAAIEQLNRNLSEENADTKDLDRLLKYTTAIRNLATDTSVYGIIEMAELFLTWLYHRDIELAQLFSREFDLFITERNAA